MASSRVSDGFVGSAVRNSGASAPSLVRIVLERVEQLLRNNGWCQGRAHERAGRLSLDGAIEVAASELGASPSQRLELAARARNLLARAAGAGSVNAWNDDRAREYADVVEVLAIARALAEPPVVIPVGANEAVPSTSDPV